MINTSRKPSEGWKQQNCTSFMFIPSKKFAIFLYLFIAVTNLAIGGALWSQTNLIQEYKAEYACNASTCKVSLDVTEKIAGPVFVYYEINGYYQNHRIYVKSRSPKQLAGGVYKVSDLSECAPITTVSDLELSGTQLTDKMPANPCGLIAKSFFQDTFDFPSGITVKETGIAWPTDLKGKFQNAANYEEIQWHSVEDEHFIVWMRIAATSEFRKLWGIIEKDLNKGSYEITVHEKMDFSNFDGKKFIVISNANAFGGKNSVLSYVLFASGGMAAIWTLVFIFSPCIMKK